MSEHALGVGLGQGGVDRGRGDAPMTWTDGTEEDGAKFKEQVLPVGGDLTTAQLVGVSRAAPNETPDDGAGVSTGGALTSARAGAGAAHVSVLLPEHRRVVERYFKRTGE